MSQQQQMQDEMNQRIDLLYRQIVLQNSAAIQYGLKGLDQDDLSLVRWLFGITTH